MKSIEINNLILKLNSSDEEERLYAIEDLGDFVEDEIYEIFIDLLKKETSQIVKDSILFLLKRKLSDKALPKLFELFYSEDAYLRNSGVAIFGAGDENTVKFLADRIMASDKDVKKLILDALFEIGSPEAGGIISGEIWNEYPNVKITAIEYTGRLGMEDKQEELLALFVKEDEPMIVLSILMALQLFEKFTYLKIITKRLCPSGDLKSLNGMYMEELIKLTAKFGDKTQLLVLIEAMHEDIIQSHEVIEFLITATNRFKELIDDQSVKDLLIICLQNPIRDEKLIFNLFRIMNKSLDKNIIKITEEFMSNQDSDIEAFCESAAQALKLNKEINGTNI